MAKKKNESQSPEQKYDAMENETKETNNIEDIQNLSGESTEKDQEEVNIFLRDNNDFLSFKKLKKNIQNKTGKELQTLNKNNRTALIALAVIIIIVVIFAIVSLRGSSLSTGNTTDVSGNLSDVSSDSTGTTETSDISLSLSEDDALNQLMVSYYTALADGDVDQIATIVDPTDKNYLAQIKAESEYIDSYPAINVYTKPGLLDGTYIAYVYTEVQMTGYNKYVPGLATYYVCTKDDGSYYINRTEELSEDVAEYIHSLDLQDDVIDLNNKVTAEFNDLLADDSSFASYYTEVYGDVTTAIGSAIEEASTEEETTETETTEASDEQTESTTSTTTQVKATDVVNIRVSDSENADKLGKAQIGDTFDLLEQKENGWSKISFEGQDGYIKSEYLETVEDSSEESASDTDSSTNNDQSDADSTTDDQSDADTDTDSSSSESKTILGSDGYVYATTTVNIRASESTTSEKLGTVYTGTKLKLIMSQADGWCRVEYEGETGYVKSEYLE